MLKILAAAAISAVTLDNSSRHGSVHAVSAEN